MFRIINCAPHSLPLSYSVAPSASFQPGMIAQLHNDFCGVSDGTNPIGIIDDVRTLRYTSNCQEDIVLKVQRENVTRVGSQYYLHNEVKQELKNVNIIVDSFSTDNRDVHLIPKNGIVIFPEGTKLNLADSSNEFEAKTTVKYTYEVPNVPGDDTTIGSGRVTVWNCAGLEFQTDMYDVRQAYRNGDKLFCNSKGVFSTIQETSTHRVVGTVLSAPNANTSGLHAAWLGIKH